MPSAKVLSADAMPDQGKVARESSMNHLVLVQRRLREALGPEAMKELHRERPALDVLAMLGVYATFLACAHALGTLRGGPLWFFCLGLQGVVLMWMGLINHDLFVHRRFGPKHISWWLSLLFTMPLTLSNTGYHDAHHRHHRFLGTDKDGEAYKQLLDTRLRRLVFCTVVGVQRVVRGGYFRVQSSSSTVRLRQRHEQWTKLLYVCLVAVLACYWPRHVLLGYVLPLVTVLPVLNGVRIIIEHADADPENPFALATFYRTGILTRVLCFWDSGDCHIVHHVFPNIPFYNMGKAVDLIRPVLIAEGVVERRSLRELFLGWFLHNYGHRTRWPASADPRAGS